MITSLFLGTARTMLVAAAVFIPFERLAALHPAQRVFRKGWATDVLAVHNNRARAGLNPDQTASAHRPPISGCVLREVNGARGVWLMETA